MGTDGALGEHIRLALEAALLVQHLQRTQQEIAGVLPKGQTVAPAGQQTIFLRVLVVEGIELRLLSLNILVGIALGLVVNKPAHTIPEGNHSPDAVLRRNGNLHRIHAAVFPEVYLAVHNGVTEIPHIGVSGNGVFFLLQFLMLALGDFCMKILNGTLQQLRQVSIFIPTAHAVHAEPGGLHDHLAQNHIGILDEIAVHSDAIGIGVQMHPVRFNVRHAVPLLQEQNIAGDFRSGIALESVIGQTDSTDEVSPLCKIFANSGVLFVHRTLAGNERHNAAGSDLVQRLSEKVIMDQPMVLVIPLVQHSEIAKGHIADDHIKEAVGHLHLFKAGDGNGAVLIELLGDASGDGIQLHTVGVTACHAVGEHTDKVAHAAGRLQNVALPEAHLLQCLIHGLNDDWGGVESGQRAGSGGGVFFFGKQGFQLLIFAVLFVKAVRQTAPAHIPGENLLLNGRCQSAFILDAFQHTDGSKIGSVFFAGGAIAQFRVGDAEIAALFPGNLRVQRIKSDALPLRFRLGRNWGGRLLCCFGICHHLLDERVALQSVRVNHFTVDNTPLC